MKNGDIQPGAMFIHKKEVELTCIVITRYDDGVFTFMNMYGEMEEGVCYEDDLDYEGLGVWFLITSDGRM